MIVTAYAQLVPLTNTGWAITGSGTAVQILQGNNPANYLSAITPFFPPNNGKCVATNFGFTIPPGSTITGVAFEIGYKSIGAQGPSVSLTKDGVTPDGYYAAPASTPWAAWGVGGFAGYTLAQVNASTFGVIVSAIGAAGTKYVDWLFLQISYVPSDYHYSGSAVFGFTTNTSYNFHPASGVNAYNYSGSAVFGFTTASSYSTGSAWPAPPYEGTSKTTALYTGTSSTI